ncbi:hypothetical protein ACLSU7_03245 [Bdellovibrio sp. HCB185ZH]|uniref:hypothetical protein n=1 Tax=Bdellovibrio sp. HCB185ZH TaxID=3394235 RepID=UPI0039A56341
MKDIKNDFESFKSDAGETAGSSFVLNKIRSEISATAPRKSSVAMKLGGIHLVSSFFTLMACPQFGTRLFFSGEGLMDVFMKISPAFCQTFCGAFYLAVTFLMARVLLKYDEWLVLMRSRVLTIGSVALLSLGVFAMLARGISFEAGLLWVFGAVVAGEMASASRMTLKKFFSRA